MEIILLILFLSALIYTAIVIAEEKRAYRENARSFRLGCFHFSTPPWWNVQSHGKEKILFTTSSGWGGTFLALPPHRETLRQGLARHVGQQQIVFDDPKVSNPSPVVTESVQILRMEGTATEKEETRIYLDIFLMECLKTGQRLYGESKSSVLGGTLEGPWFEECLNSCYAILPDEKQGVKNNGFFLSKT